MELESILLPGVEAKRPIVIAGHIYLINDPKVAILIKSFIHRSYKCEGKLLHLYQMIKRPLTRFTTRNIQFLKCASKLSHLTNSQLIPCFRL